MAISNPSWATQMASQLAGVTSSDLAGGQDRIGQRQDALRRAIDTMRLWSLDDVDTEHLIIVADWLLTGTADTALQFADQRSATYGAPDGEVRVWARQRPMDRSEGDN